MLDEWLGIMPEKVHGSGDVKGMLEETKHILNAPHRYKTYGIGREQWQVFKALRVFFMGMRREGELPGDVISLIVDFSFRAALLERIICTIRGDDWYRAEASRCVSVISLRPGECPNKGFYIDLGSEVVYIHHLFFCDDWMQRGRLDKLASERYAHYRRMCYVKAVLFIVYTTVLLVDWLYFSLALSQRIVSRFFAPRTTELDMATVISVGFTSFVLHSLVNPIKVILSIGLCYVLHKWLARAGL